MRKLGFFSGALWSRQHKGLNSILLWLGPRGIGKSYGCLKIGEIFDKDFCVDRVVFNLQSFLEAIKKLKKPYSWLVFDEMGLSVPAREWLSTTNKIMSYTTQSFRFTKINLSIATPSPDYVDIHSRQLADFWMVLQSRGLVRVYKVSMNPFSKKSLQTPYLGDLKLGLPSNRLQESYEEKRKEVMESKYTEYLKQAKRKREEELKKDRNLLEEALEIKDKLIGKRGKIDAYKIATELDIGLSSAYLVKHQIEKIEDE